VIGITPTTSETTSTYRRTSAGAIFHNDVSVKLLLKQIGNATR
jgi:hypothetical protein